MNVLNEEVRPYIFSKWESMDLCANVHLHIDISPSGCIPGSPCSAKACLCCLFQGAGAAESDWML